MTVPVRRTILSLVAVAVTLAALGLFVALADALRAAGVIGSVPPSMVLRMFDLDHEGNLPTWFQSTLLLAGALLCVMVAAGATAGATGWRLFGAGLFVMSCDEIASVHELVGYWISGRLDDSRFGVYAWLLPGILVAGVLVAIARRSIPVLSPGTRRLVLVAGLIFFTGALGLEVVEAALDEPYYGTWVFRLVAWVQECLETTGDLVFLYALMTHLRDRPRPSEIRFTD